MRKVTFALADVPDLMTAQIAIRVAILPLHLFLYKKASKGQRSSHLLKKLNRQNVHQHPILGEAQIAIKITRPFEIPVYPF